MQKEKRKIENKCLNTILWWRERESGKGPQRLSATWQRRKQRPRDAKPGSQAHQTDLVTAALGFRAGRRARQRLSEICLILTRWRGRLHLSIPKIINPHILTVAFIKCRVTCNTQDYISLVIQMVKTPPAMQETQGPSLGQEDPLENEMATHSSILAWRIPRTEKPGELSSMGSQRIGHDWVNKTFTFFHPLELQ